MPVGEQIGALLVEALIEVGVEERVPPPGERLRGGVEDGEARELAPKCAGGFVENDRRKVPEGSGGGCAAHFAEGFADERVADLGL